MFRFTHRMREGEGPVRGRFLPLSAGIRGISGIRKGNLAQ